LHSSATASGRTAFNAVSGERTSAADINAQRHWHAMSGCCSLQQVHC
jgi:hypothetical protein